MAEDLSKYADEILTILGNKVSRDEIKKELENYLNKKVPAEIAKQSIVKKYGGNISMFEGTRKTLSELKPNEKNVDILCRIMSINPKIVNVNNKEKKIFYGLLGDQTDTKPFTAWDDFKLKKNDVAMIHNAYTTEWKGIIQVNLGRGASITKESQEMVPSIEYKGMTKKCKIADFREGLRNIVVEAKIVSVKERKINVKGVEKIIYSGVLGDETGKAQFTAWHNFDLKENENIKIMGGYIKTNRGRPELNFDEKIKDERIKKEIRPVDRKISISELTKIGGGVDLIVNGNILDVKNGSGLIFRCPECKRKTQNNVCMIHGKVEGVPDLRTKAVIDDGTGALSVLFGKNITEKILGKGLDECKKIAHEKMSVDVIADELGDKILIKNMEVKGYTLKDDYGITLVADDADFVKRNSKEEARKMLEETL